MKFEIKREILLNGLNIVSKAMSSKNLIPILSGIKFELKKEGLYLTCSDEDITIQFFIDKKEITKIDYIGSSVIPGKYIIDIFRKLPCDIINIETDGSKILITTDSSEYHLNGMEVNDYPHYNLNISKTPVSISKKEFKDIVNQTVFAVSHQESRPILTGINFKINGDTFEAIATDSYRLAKKKINLEKEVQDQLDFVIPGKNLTELMKIVEDDDKKIKIHIFSNYVLFEFDDILFLSRLLSGTFPNVSNLIPSEFKIEVDINPNDLFNVIDRASILSDREKNVVRFEINKNELIVGCDSLELGKVEERMTIDEIIKEKIKISFNARYMLEALRSFQGKKIKILYNEEIKPIIIKDLEKEDLIQLILPIKTY
jgi:DNA polymerase III subunit beta